jgi:hypothetical protein
MVASRRALPSHSAPPRRFAPAVALPSLRRLACVAAALVIGIAIMVSLAPRRVLAQAGAVDCPQSLRYGNLDGDMGRTGRGSPA